MRAKSFSHLACSLFSYLLGRPDVGRPGIDRPTTQSADRPQIVTLLAPSFQGTNTHQQTRTHSASRIDVGVATKGQGGEQRQKETATANAAFVAGRIPFRANLD